jgi:uncharacterized membrane protein
MRRISNLQHALYKVIPRVLRIPPPLMSGNLCILAAGSETHSVKWFHFSGPLNAAIRACIFDLLSSLGFFLQTAFHFKKRKKTDHSPAFLV